jgi:hypothetical protein
MINTLPEHHLLMQQRLHQLNEPQLTQDFSHGNGSIGNVMPASSITIHNPLRGTTLTANAAGIHYREELKENHPTSNGGLHLQDGTLMGGNGSAWQGDAFNRTDKLVHSPTPCLKIRNMFDPVEMEADAALCTTRIHNDIIGKVLLESQCAHQQDHCGEQLDLAY